MKTMTRFLLVLALTCGFMGITHAAYETTEQTNILFLNKQTRNLVIERDQALWMLYYSGICDEMQQGGTVTLVITGDLNGNSDYLKINEYRQCKIEQVEKITGRLSVDYVYNGNTDAFVTDPKGTQFEVEYDSRCQGIPRYWKDYVYVYQYGSVLAKDDKIFLPRHEGECPLLHVQKVPKGYEVAKTLETGDKIPPDLVRDVSAVPANASITVNWTAASDNVGVAYYWVSYSRYHIDPKDYSLLNMPNLTRSNSNHLTISKLQNGVSYFVYVLAVDKSGNVSPAWSPEVKVSPSASIGQIPQEATGKLNLRKISESAQSFFFVWNWIPGTERQNVILTSNDKVDQVIYDYLKYSFRVTRTDALAGKTLVLTVKSYDIHGQMKEESFTFQFQK